MRLLRFFCLLFLCGACSVQPPDPGKTGGSEKTLAAPVSGTEPFTVAEERQDVVGDAVEAPAHGDPQPTDHHTISSPEWLRLSSIVSAIHPFPSAHRIPGYPVDVKPGPDGEGSSFDFIMPSQGMPGFIYQPAMWAEFHTKPENSVKWLDYRAMEWAARTVHRKGNWIIPHAPASAWWYAISTNEAPQIGAVYMNMQLLANDPPPDGFNFDAILNQGADLDAVRRMSEKVLPGGRFVMLGEYDDPPAYNSHMSYLYGPQPNAWADDLHGQLYIGYGVLGLDSNIKWVHGEDVSGQTDAEKQNVPQDIRLRLGLWDAMFWGGITAWFQPFPGGFLTPDETQRLMDMVRTFRSHTDLQGLIKSPRLLPDAQLLQEGFAVHHFDGADDAYFQTADSPGADKQMYVLKTGGYTSPLGDPDYYVNLPPTPDAGPEGDLFTVPYDEGTHWISIGVDRVWPTPVRRDGDRLVIRPRERVAVYGETPKPGETVAFVQYRNILNVSRVGAAGLMVQVDKSYGQNLSVELELRRPGAKPRSHVVVRPVVNQRAAFDLAKLFSVEDIRPDDVLTIRLYREHVLDEWHVIPLLCDEVVIDSGDAWVALPASPTLRPVASFEMMRDRRIEPGEKSISTERRFRHATLEFRARFGDASARDSWVGFMDPAPSDWNYEWFHPETGRDVIAWNQRLEKGAPQLEAFFDNGSGLVERSGGITVLRGSKDSPTAFNANEHWGDYLWPFGNSRIDAFDPAEFHTYRIEWQRLWQRWYIDGELVYERQQMLNEPLPVTIQNRGDSAIDIEWLRVTP